MISVVGGGASGIGAAYSLLSAGHAVSIYEAESNLGGHCYGVPIECLNGEVAYVDAGVSDFNQQTVPDLIQSRPDEPHHGQRNLQLASLRQVPVQNLRTPVQSPRTNFRYMAIRL